MNYLEQTAYDFLIEIPGFEPKDVYCAGGGCNWGLSVSPNIPVNFIDIYPPTACVGIHCYVPREPPVCTVDCGPISVPIVGTLPLLLIGLILMRRKLK